jgi:TonB-dependent Receptor Plug Domain
VTVTVAASGFEGYHATTVVVQVGQMTTLEPHLATGAASQVVEVTASAPIMNFDSPDFASNLNQRALQDIPINNRRWSSLAMTTPGVVDNGTGFGLVSVRGINGILNSVLIDGVDDNQAYYSEERGRTREAYSTSGSAIREFAVNTGVYPAEYGRAAGGVINSVTKSGSNTFHGEAYFYDRESNWNAFNDFSRLTTPIQNPTTLTYTFPSIPLKPKDLRKIYGFTVGGALIMDKLFFTYTYDQHSRIFPGQAIPGNAATFYTLPNATTTGTCNTATGLLTGDTNALDQQVCTLAARTNPAGGYAAAFTLYSNDIVGLNSDLGTVPRTGYQEINTPKIDYQINGKEHLSLLFHRLRWDSPGGVQTTGTDNYGTDTWGNDFVKLDYGVAKLTSLVTSDISNELVYQYSRELDDETQQPFSAYSKANLFGNGGSNIPEILLDASVFANIGSPYYSYRLALPDERKWQIGDLLHYDRGNHSFSFGGDVLNNYDLLNNLYRSNGYETYSFLANYMADLYNKGKANDTCNSTALSTATATTSAVGVDPCYSSLSQGFGASPTFAISTLDYSFFGQDNWKATPRLTLELGVRYDDELLPTPSAKLTAAATE